MKYLFLAYGDEKRLEAMSTGERDAFENACRASDEMLRNSGHLLVVEGLQSSRTATTVRVWNGKVSVTDGPFVETNEQLIGLFFVNARDLNEAHPGGLEDATGARRPYRGKADDRVRPTVIVTMPNPSPT